MLEMFTMRPHFRSTIPGASAFCSVTALDRLVATVKSQCFSMSIGLIGRSAPWKVPGRETPALFTRISQRPIRD